MIGIIGTGWGTRVQAPAFKLAGLDVVALAARDQAKTEQQARDLGIAFATTAWRALLDRADVRLVSIVTPPAMHHEIAIAALAAGKHVLCEKPMALDVAETQAMLDAASARPDQIAIIDHELRFLPSLQLARARVQRGDFGALRHVEAFVLGGGRSDPQRAWNWWSDAEQGGGLLGAIGSHQFDTLQFLFGPISAVNGMITTFIAERPSDTGLRPVTADDYASIMLRFSNGGLGTVTMSVVAATNEPNRLTAHFERGALRFEGGRVLFAERSGEFRDATPADRVAVPDQFLRGGEFPVGTVYLAHALRRALDNDRSALDPAATFADGHRIQRLLDAVRQGHVAGGGWTTIEG